MYLEHFGLRYPPFRATPDPALFYTNAVYREAYATLQYGVLERQGFVVLTGEVGTGKTTLLRRLMGELGACAHFVFFHHSALTFDEMIELIGTELGLSLAGLSRVQRLRCLDEFLVAEARRDRRVALLIDEAQHLDAQVLEHLRLVSNLETSTGKLLQIVLVGQPELEAKLADPALRQLAQRIALRFRLSPLGDDEVGEFIAFRLRQCGRPRQDLFTNRAVRRIAGYSRGIPRVVNRLCDRALLHAYAVDATRVTGAMVDEVAVDLGLLPALAESGREPPPPRRLRAPGGGGTSGARPWAVVGVAGALLAIGLTGLLSGDRTQAVADLADFVRAHLARLAIARPAGPATAAPPEAKATSAPEPEPAPAADPPDPSASPRRDAAPEGSPPAGRSSAVVPAGANLWNIVTDRYGAQHLLALDLVKDLNPHIADLDRVAAGERVWLPELTPAALARRQPDGSWQLPVTSALTAEAAQRAARDLQRVGYDARVQARRVTPGLRLHRVVIARLADAEAAGRAWRAWQASRTPGPAPAAGGARG